MKKKHTALLSLVLCLCLCLLLPLPTLFSGCGKKDAGEGTKLSFSEAVSFDTIKKLNGKTVAIVGYMATLSPVSGEFMSLMNLPYQSCPFCKPNSTELTNTMAVYAPKGKKFTFTDQAVRVTGRIEVGDFTDNYGYKYNYRIVDAEVAVVDLSSAENEMLALWYSVASDGVVTAINDMFNYVYFVCNWPEYCVKDKNGKIAYYLYPKDVERYLADTSVNGYADKAAPEYFPGLARRIRGISSDKLEDLVALTEAAQVLEQKALAELRAKNYTSAPAADVGGGELKYTLTNGAALLAEYNVLYDKYLAWIAKWEV